MEERLKVRILLLNPAGDILLMKIEDHTVSDPEARGNPLKWITIGGSIEPGETINEAARREAHEETGIPDIEIGKVIEYRERALNIEGQPVMFRETFVAATTGSWTLDFSLWTPEERILIKDMRWWSLHDLKMTDEVVLPAHLSELMVMAASG